MSTLILSHNDCLKHVEPAGHPERVKRLEKVLDVLKLSIFNDLTWKEAPLAKKEQIALCHSSDYINKIEKNLSNFHYNVIIANIHEMYSFFINENRMYENILPPLSLLNKADQTDLIHSLKDLNFKKKSSKAA